MQFIKTLAVASGVLATAALAAPSTESFSGMEARLFGGSGYSSGSVVQPGLPSKDPFYKPSGSWQSKSNGAILNSRQVKPGSSAAKTAYQILYKTTDAVNNPDSTVVTILVPKTPKSPPQIVGIQLPEDSVSIDCAPSATLASGTNSPNALGGAFTNQGVDGSLNNGYYVVIPDHEGSKALAFVGPMEGHAVLDGLKAVTNFPTGIPGVSSSTPIAIGGYSGGAHATAWAAQLAPSYAPGLNIKGQVIGGTPVNLTSVLLYLNKGTYAGFAAVGVAGEYLAYSDLHSYIDQYIYPNGTALFKKLQNNQCLASVAFLGGYGGKDLFSYFKKANPLDDPVPRKRLAQNLLGGDGNALVIPTIMYHGTKDDIIPYQDAVDYAKAQCSKGAKVHFISDAGNAHINEELARGNDLTKWLDQTLQGTADFSCNL
ncbi:hypothetical protein OC861_005103 [Tilletia horrida]|nr:hypothetical protein OC845_003801 [Tilletia horrida]KAK0562887.1 hypothetical protein OC861_005103 [Tilletia horrida]